MEREVKSKVLLSGPDNFFLSLLMMTDPNAPLLNFICVPQKCRVNQPMRRADYGVTMEEINPKGNK